MTLELVDALVELVEPAATRIVAVDDSGAEPSEYLPSTLYGWISADEETIAEGLQKQHGFEVTLVLVSAETAEEAELERDETVSIYLSAKREAYLAAIQGSRATAMWDDLVGSADEAFIRALDVRGLAVRARGYRFLA